MYPVAFSFFFQIAFDSVIIPKPQTLVGIYMGWGVLIHGEWIKVGFGLQCGSTQVCQGPYIRPT